MSASVFNRDISPLVPDDAKEFLGKGRGYRYNAPVVIETMLARRVETATRHIKATPSAPADPMLAGDGDSPALERYRLAKAKEAELKYSRDLGKWMSLEDIREGCGVIAARIRGACESLQRQFGPGAREIMDEALEDAEREINVRFAEQEDLPGIDGS